MGGFRPSTNVNGSISTAADPGLTVFLITSMMQSQGERPTKINQVEPELLVQFNECGIRPEA